jgi:3-isopropylmalate/(R)-2-methylmalate dehydratase small subunit
MEKFTKLTSRPAYMPLINIDTDMIIPKQFLKTITKKGLGKSLFFEMRYDNFGNEIEDFVLNKQKDAKILLAGDNFGCGSSREHAPWALADFGIRCVIAPSFADIFFNNSYKNGILLIKMPEADIKEMSKTSELTVDLNSCEIKTAEGKIYKFETDEFRRTALLEGLDEIGITLKKDDLITSFEENQKKSQPWL